MKMAGFTAEAALERANGHYGRTAFTSARPAGSVRAALVAPTVCRTSSCLKVGNCRTKVRCCRNFLGSCTCSTVPCFFLGPPEQF